MRRAKENRRGARYLSILLLIVLLVSSALLLLRIWEKKQGEYHGQGTGEKDPTLVHDGREYLPKENIRTLLVLGLDKFEEEIDNTAYNNDQSADFVMLLVLNDEAKTCTPIHINRDTMVEMNVLGVAGQTVSTVTKQLALAHTYGNGKEVSCRNTADAVSLLLKDVKINHYVSVTMSAVPVFNDLVGGVEVTVLDDFSGIDDTLVKGETVLLRGEHALNYVRDRYGMDDSTNQNRMKRQRQYLNALRGQAMKAIEADEAFIVDATLTMSEFMVSDCSVNQLQTLFEKISTYQFEEIRALEGESVLGEEYMEFYPDEEALTELVIEMFYEPKA